MGEKPPIRCPLCGKTETVKEEPTEHENGIGGPWVDSFVISCTECDLHLHGKDQVDARQKWNRRAPMKIVIKQQGT